MPMNKAEWDAFLGKFKEGFAKSVKTMRSKGDPETDTDETQNDVRVKKENLSLIKYARGVATNDWSGAQEEQKAFKKALGQDDGSQGGVLVPRQISTDIIELLKPQVVVENLPGVRTMNLDGSIIDFGSVDTGPSVSWGRENTSISEDTTMDFGKRTLEGSKCVCLYKMGRELARNSSAENLVRDEVAAEMALERDKVVFEGTGGDEPTGIYYRPDVLSTDLSGTIDQDDITDAIYQVKTNAYAKPTAFVSTARTEKDLAQLKDGNGRPIFGTGPGVSEIESLYGVPYYKSEKLAETSRPASTETYLVGGVWKWLLIGESEDLRIEASTQAGDAFQYDQLWLKFVSNYGFMLRHPAGFVVVKGIQER